MNLNGVIWFDIERESQLINSLLLLFDNLFVPNTLWLETGSKFEDIYFELSTNKKEIYNVVLSPIFLGDKPSHNSISFESVYGTLPFQRVKKKGIFVSFFEILKCNDKYPKQFNQIIFDIFSKVNKVSSFPIYNEFTFQYTPFIYNGLYFIGKKETRGDNSSSWIDNYKKYIEECLNIQRNFPLITNSKTIVDLEKYNKVSSQRLRNNTEILASALLFYVSKIILRKFTIKDTSALVALRSSLFEERRIFTNNIRKQSLTLHSLLGENISFIDLLNEAEFIVKADILPAYENFRIKYEKEISKSVIKKFIAFSDNLINFGLSAFTLNYSEAKKSLKLMQGIITGKELQYQLNKSETNLSDYFYLLKLENSAT